MSEKIKVYQKPTCTKCRQTLARLNECGVEFEAVNYYEMPLTEAELRKLVEKLGIPPRELLRKGEAIYRELELGKREVSDDELIRLMVKHPDLMQRPIVVRGDKAVLARPVENLDQLL
ncbi:MAG TPA: arsenate reductase (glutaredoxin) [Blastocatellia bacterium]|nr:arsenate reductase (glutaredoxin) [Blastocatellia bacterium]